MYDLKIINANLLDNLNIQDSNSIQNLYYIGISVLQNDPKNTDFLKRYAAAPATEKAISTKINHSIVLYQRQKPLHVCACD